MLIYNAVWFALPIAALAICIVHPDAARDAVVGCNGGPRHHSRGILLVASFGVGVALVIRGALLVAGREGAVGLAPGVDQGQHVGQPQHRRVRLAAHRALLVRGDVAVREQDRPHADLLGAVDVVPQPVADEHRAPRVPPERGKRGPEGLRVRLGPLDLAGVDRGVDQVEPRRLGERPGRARCAATACWTARRS